MLIKTELTHLSGDICINEFKERENYSSLLTAKLEHVVNIPEELLFYTKEIKTPLGKNSTLDNVIFVSPDETLSVPPSPTPSQMLLNAHELQRSLQEVKTSIAVDDNKESYQEFLVRHAQNMGLTICRNLISVAIPTAMREYVRRAVLPVLFKNMPSYVIPTMSGITAGLPVALQLLAIARDAWRGTQTPETLRARVANSLLVIATGSALVASGGLTAAANALIAAIFVYVPLRDIAQYFVMLKDNNKNEFYFSPSWKSAASYAGNQVVVDQGMEILSQALTPLMGSVVANMLGRAIMNTAGETCDELVYRGFSAQQQKNPAMKMSLSVRPSDSMSLETALDQIANTLTSRACIFSASFSSGYAVPFGGVLNSMVVGATMGSGYVPFIYAHAQKPTKNQAQIALDTQQLDDMEAGRLPG